MRKKLMQMGIDPITHEPRTNSLSPILDISQMLAAAINNGQFGNNNLVNNSTPLEDLLKLQLIHKMLQIITPKAIPNINSFNANSVNPKPEPAATQLNAIDPHVFIRQDANEESFENIWDGLVDNRLPGLVTVSQENLNTAKPGTSTTTEVYDQTRAGVIPGYYGDQILSSGSVSVSPVISGSNHPGSALHSSCSDVLEDWEKFLDDETSDSCWKSFLE